MKEKKNIESNIDKIRELNLSSSQLDDKLDDLIFLLQNSELDSDAIAQLQGRFNTAIESHKLSIKDVNKFKILDDAGKSRLDLANDLELLLSQSTIDSQNIKELKVVERSGKFFTLLIGLALIALGFAMIVMPAPPYFEMFTVFYFTRDDGVTLMDLIALLIVFGGIYITFTSLVRSKK